MALSQDRIVDVALQLLERDGLDGVSFRKIAAKLDVSAPTLYWHVDSKRRLLDLMAARLMAQTEQLRPAAPGHEEEPWWEWLEGRTRAMYETLIRHRDAPLVAAGNRPPVTALPSIEGSLTKLTDAGFEPGDAIEIILTLGAFATGCALEWQAEEARTLADESEGELGDEIRGGGYPTLLKAFTQHRERHQKFSPHDQMFEHGLALMITGLRVRLGERQL